MVMADKHTEDQANALKQELERRGVPGGILPYPDFEDELVQDHRTQGFYSCAYPSQFNTGVPDFNDPRRHRGFEVKYQELEVYAQFLMEYHDLRFQRCVALLHHLFHAVERWKIVAHSGMWSSSTRAAT